MSSVRSGSRTRSAAAGIDGVDDASTFFASEGSAIKAAWRGFRAAPDKCGRRPHDSLDVVEGAQSTFLAIERWMDATDWRGA